MKAQDLADLDKGGAQLLECIGHPFRCQPLGEVVLVRYREDLSQPAGISYETVAQRSVFHLSNNPFHNKYISRDVRIRIHDDVRDRGGDHDLHPARRDQTSE